MVHERTPYVIPRYRAADAAFYHVLHGNVPDHQIDFMYCPEVPQGSFTATHFGHLSRVLKYIEAPPGARYAFSIVNLSRDDTHFEPGRGGLALILGLRIEGAVDHAGRKDPPFTHAIATVDRDMSCAVLLESAVTFFRHILSESEVERSTTDFYRRYLSCCLEDAARLPDVLREYISGFDDLPRPARSQRGLAWKWKVGEGAEPKQVVILYDDAETFGAIAHCAAKIAAVLYRSNIRWTQITSGGERELPGGVSVRLVMQRNAPAPDPACSRMMLHEVPDEEAELAERLFGAEPAREEASPRLGWREKFAYRDTPAPAEAANESALPGAAHEGAPAAVHQAAPNPVQTPEVTPCAAMSRNGQSDPAWDRQSDPARNGQSDPAIRVQRAASTASRRSRNVIAGVVAGLAGVLIVVGSMFAWEGADPPPQAREVASSPFVPARLVPEPEPISIEPTEPKLAAPAAIPARSAPPAVKGAGKSGQAARPSAPAASTKQTFKTEKPPPPEPDAGRRVFDTPLDQVGENRH